MITLTKKDYLFFKGKLKEQKSLIETKQYMYDDSLPYDDKFTMQGEITDPLYLPKQFLNRFPIYRVGLLKFYELSPEFACLISLRCPSNEIDMKLKGNVVKFKKKDYWGDGISKLVPATAMLKNSNTYYGWRLVRMETRFLALRCSATELV